MGILLFVLCNFAILFLFKLTILALQKIYALNTTVRWFLALPTSIFSALIFGGTLIFCSTFYENSFLNPIFKVLGAIVTVASFLIILYNILPKYNKGITFSFSLLWGLANLTQICAEGTLLLNDSFQLAVVIIICIFTFPIKKRCSSGVSK